ncbi:MAG: hypothetical protein OSB10_00245 [Planctomycetota bacterium]|nr:hypothetical protein [Planctomycetota bacterium]
MSDASMDLDLADPSGRKTRKWANASAWIDDRLNPVLVKEVRQALRGKQFRSAFLLTVMVSVIAAVSIVLVNSGGAEWSPIGPPFFQGIFMCLSIAVVGFVPMSTFTAMGAEWEENTYDLLILSHLRPRHIVIGKLLGAGAQALLYFSVFTPYIVFTFLLGGVDLKIVMISLPMLAVISFALSAFAAALSSLTDKRMARVALMVFLAATLVGACIAVISITFASIKMSIDFTAYEVRLGFTAALLIALMVFGYSVAIAIARLSHPEENHSTGLRALTSVFVIAVLGWIAWANSFLSQPDFVAVNAMMLIGVVTLVSIFFMTERETLGLRVKNHLPSSGILRLLVFPWLPGGARGTVWMLMTLSIIVVASVNLMASSTIGSLLGPPGSPASTSAFGMRFADFPTQLILGTAAFSVFYLSIPSALLTNRNGDLQRSTFARVMIPVLFLGGILTPILVGFLLKIPDMSHGNHLGNPFVFFDKMQSGNTNASSILFLASMALALQIFRIFRSIQEVKNAPRAGALASIGTGVALERVPEADDDLEANA